jgi:hypothetical protein
MPSNVAWFERLIYLDLGISILLTILDFSNYGEQQADEMRIGYVITLPLIVLATLLLVWMVAHRRMSWARWALLGLVLASDLAALYDWLAAEVERDALVVSLLNLVTYALEISAFYLIFTGNARDWFSATSKA